MIFCLFRGKLPRWLYSINRIECSLLRLAFVTRLALPLRESMFAISLSNTHILGCKSHLWRENFIPRFFFSGECRSKSYKRDSRRDNGVYWKNLRARKEKRLRNEFSHHSQRYVFVIFLPVWRGYDAFLINQENGRNWIGFENRYFYQRLSVQ